MTSPFEVRCLLSHGGAMVIGILQTMCHVITDVTADHRPSSRTVLVLPVRYIPTPTPYNEENSGTFGWRFGVAVTRWSRSTQLLYIEPG